MANLITTILLFGFGLILLSLMLTFSGIMNLLLSFFALIIITFFGAFSGRDVAKYSQIGACLFFIIFSISPFFFFKNDFCKYQSESYTQDYIKDSTPKEFFETGRLAQTKSRILSKSLEDECLNNTSDFILKNQPFFNIFRGTFFLFGIGYLILLLTKNSDSYEVSGHSDKKNSPTGNDLGDGLDHWRDQADNICTSKHRGLLDDIHWEAGFKPNGDYYKYDDEIKKEVILMFNKVLDFLPELYSKKEIDNGMLERRRKKILKKRNIVEKSLGK